MHNNAVACHAYLHVHIQRCLSIIHTCSHTMMPVAQERMSTCADADCTKHLEPTDGHHDVHDISTYLGGCIRREGMKMNCIGALNMQQRTQTHINMRMSGKSTITRTHVRMQEHERIYARKSTRAPEQTGGPTPDASAAARSMASIQSNLCPFVSARSKSQFANGKGVTFSSAKPDHTYH